MAPIKAEVNIGMWASSSASCQQGKTLDDYPYLVRRPRHACSTRSSGGAMRSREPPPRRLEPRPKGEGGPAFPQAPASIFKSPGLNGDVRPFLECDRFLR